ncbi:MAG: TIGR02147 family protein [Chitinispirillaceae bacterium]
MTNESIYQYVNYRHYLKDFLAEHKRRKTFEFSHKMILHRMGISSSGFLSNVIAGRKNLTQIQIVRLSRIMELKKTEAAYFESMVHFTQAKNVVEKDEYFNRLIKLQKIQMKVLDKKKMSLFSKSYYVFIRELLYYYKHRDSDSPEALAKMLEPAITPAQAREALDYLCELELVEKDENGVYRQKNGALTSGDEVRSLHLAKFQLETMDLAKRALEKVPASRRDISVLTMTVSEESFRQMKAEVQHFRKRMAKIAIEQEHPDQVYQLNIQLFPVARKLVP